MLIFNTSLPYINQVTNQDYKKPQEAVQALSATLYLGRHLGFLKYFILSNIAGDFWLEINSVMSEDDFALMFLLQIGLKFVVSLLSMQVDLFFRQNACTHIRTLED